MRVRELVEELERIAPSRYAESWDNVGLLAGDPDANVSRVLVTIDLTREVADEAFAAGVDLVISYHPPIFEGLKRVAWGTPVAEALRRGVALYSPHTALDVAPGGTNDVLADLCGIAAEGRSALRVTQPKDSEYKLVTFVPEEALARVSEALFAAGAGRIGKYSSCSFRSPGTGTFFGEEGTNPTVGAAGKLEQAEELRLETVLPIARLAPVLQALRASHPYEEPAFDLVRLAVAPASGRGLGRIGPLTGGGVPRQQLIATIKSGLGVGRLLVAGPREGDAERVAVCAGACGDLYKDAIAQKADLYVTGELRHHDALAAAARGLTVVAALHSNSERRALDRLAERLREHVEVVRSARDRDPFDVV